MSGPKGICLECNKPVTAKQLAVYKVEAHEKERPGGGMNQGTRKRRVDGVIWHQKVEDGDCYRKFCDREDGSGPQGSLL